MTKNSAATDGPSEPRDIGRFTTVRRDVVAHMEAQGAGARFVSTHVARETAVAAASCNNVFKTLQEYGWIVRTSTPGTAKEFKWAKGGIFAARDYLKAYEKSRAI